MTILYVLAALLLLGIMVTVHEFGHFCAARLSGIPVREFSVGFGPKLLSWSSKKYETAFCLRLIPAGGYCAFYGEDDPDADPESDSRNFNNAPVIRRIFTYIAGPVMNLLLAFVAAAVLFQCIGEDTLGTVDRAVIQSVTENSPAAAAGFQPGDRIITVNGTEMSGLTENGSLPAIDAISAYVPGDPPLEIAVERGNETLVLYAAPRYDEAEKRCLIGVSVGYEYVPGYTAISPWRAVQLGADYCIQAGGAILQSMHDLITTGAGLEETAGPVGIVRLIAEETQRYGITTYVQLLVLISVNLGLFNLLPIPGLDGSHFLFSLVELIRRKPNNRRIETYVHLAGYALLIMLMLALTFKDIRHIFR